MERSDIRFGEEIHDETELYRYMTFPQFVSFLETKQTYLTKISMWNDPWEAALDKVPVRYDNGKVELPKYSIHMDTYGQCWTLKRESEALWNIYSPNKDGVKIKTTAQKLRMISDIRRGYFDKVTYTDYKKIKVKDHVFGATLLKREAFEHEREARLLINSQAYDGIGKDQTHMYFELEPKGFIEEIVIDPRAHDWLVNTIIKYCERADIGVVPKRSELLSFDPIHSLNVYRTYIPVGNE
jgi:hypothetical protein